MSIAQALDTIGLSEIRQLSLRFPTSPHISVVGLVHWQVQLLAKQPDLYTGLAGPTPAPTSMQFWFRYRPKAIY